MRGTVTGDEGKCFLTFVKNWLVDRFDYTQIDFVTVSIPQQISKDNSPSFEVIESNFLAHILDLANDDIPNIRLAVVRLLSLLLSFNTHLLTNLDRKLKNNKTVKSVDHFHFFVFFKSF